MTDAKDAAVEIMAARDPRAPPIPDRDRKKSSRVGGRCCTGDDRFSASVIRQRGAAGKTRRKAGATEIIGLLGASMIGDRDFVRSSGDPVSFCLVLRIAPGKGEKGGITHEGEK